MLKRILASFGSNRRKKKSRIVRRNIGSNGRRLCHEHLEDRRVLATLTVNALHDNVSAFGEPLNDGDLTLRDAIAYVNQVFQPGSQDSLQINTFGGTQPLGTNDTIVFSTDPTHGLNGGTIRLQYINEATTHTVALSIFRNVTIDATMLPLGLTLDAIEGEIDWNMPGEQRGDQDGLRVFDLGLESQFDLSVTLAGLKITGGNPIDGGAGAIQYQAESGVLTIRDCKIFGNFGFGAGAISASVGSTGTNNGVRIERTEISNNVSSGQTAGAGASIRVSNGSVDILDSTISGNTSPDAFTKGGGVYVRLGVNATGRIDRSTISGNTVGAMGGGFFVLLAGAGNSRFTLSNSTVSGNHALTDVGGGGYVCQKFGGTFEAINSTISGNDALGASRGYGGGLCIAREGTAPSVNSYLNHVTITENRATSGGGLFSADDPLVKTFVNHSIISGNRNASELPNNVAGNIENTSAFNLFGTGGGADLENLGPGNIINNNSPMLSQLGNHGGPTQTHTLLAGSPAIDAGNPGAVPGSNGVPDFDQRGEPFTRKVGTQIDMGAVEYRVPPKIVDVRLRGSGWTRAPYSYSQLVAAGKQLDSIYTAGIDRIEIEFDKAVTFTGNPLTLLKTSGNPTSLPVFQGFTGNVAVWSIAGGLQADKYAIVLNNSSITDSNGTSLDADWDRPVDDMDALVGKDDKGYDWNNDQPRIFDPSQGTTGGNFRLHFAYLPGDYNQDGIVLNQDAGPLPTSRKSDLATPADGDGNGTNGQAGDMAVVNNAVAAGAIRLAAGQYRGDYSDNEIVDGSDYLVWKMTFGSTIDLRADGNANGVVDTADYTPWRNNSGTFSAWSAGPSGGGSVGGTPLVLFGEAPRVANVTISGSNSTHAPYSFATNVGSGVQLRTVPVGGADTISISFTEDVNIVASDLNLVGLRTFNRPVLADFSYDVGTMTAKWRFTGWVSADHYVIRLRDMVTDVEGNALDGEWVNPTSLATVNALVSEFPSGNGTAGGEFQFIITLLPGDINRDLVVDSTELSLIQWGMQNAAFINGDFNGSGVVNEMDAQVWYGNLNINLQNLLLRSDLNGDWAVDEADANILWNNHSLSNPTQAQGDLNGNGVINIQDLDLMFAHYGLALSVVS